MAAAGRSLDMEASGLRATLWLVFGLAAVLRLALLAVHDGSAPDIAAFSVVDQALRTEGLGLYSAVNGEQTAWPYLPGYTPVVAAVSELSQATGVAFGMLIRLPQLLADLGLAWLVQWHLGWRGAAPRTRIAAAALILFAPVSLAVTGMHGQVDPIEWLPALGAVIAWERLPQERRAPVAGLLIGLGVAIKSPAGLVLLALLPLASTWRERLVLTSGAALIPVLALLPFLLADPGGVRSIADYQSIPGHGGLNVILQPDLALLRFAGADVDGYTGASQVLQDLAPLLVLAAVGVVVSQAWRHRPPAASVVSAVILAVFVAGVNFVPFYAVWLVPFIVLAGWWRLHLALQALLLIPLFFRYAPFSVSDALRLARDGVWDEWVVAAVYVPVSVVLWAFMAWALTRWLRRPYGATAVG